MRIGDWSSDVCSSDLTFAGGLLAGVGSLLVLVFNGVMFGTVAAHLQGIGHGGPFWRFVVGHAAPELSAIVVAGTAGLRLGLGLVAPGRRRRIDALVEGGRIGGKLCIGVFARSEEHTSELQSLMRLSYARFCLKKKNAKNRRQQNAKRESRTTKYKNKNSTVRLTYVKCGKKSYSNNPHIQIKVHSKKLH